MDQSNAHLAAIRLCRPAGQSVGRSVFFVFFVFFKANAFSHAPNASLGSIALKEHAIQSDGMRAQA